MKFALIDGIVKLTLLLPIMQIQVISNDTSLYKSFKIQLIVYDLLNYVTSLHPVKFFKMLPWMHFKFNLTVKLLHLHIQFHSFSHSV